MSHNISVVNTSIQIKQGDQKQLRLLFDSWYKTLCLFANRYTSDMAQAEDIVQELFIAIWHKGYKFDNPYAMRSFLYTSVRNKCLNYLKSRQIHQETENEILHLESEAFFHDQLLEDEVHRLLYREIEALPPACRHIFTLSAEGLTNQEIADKLSISVNTVKTQKKIAYSQIRSRLKDYMLLPLLWWMA